MQLHDSRRPPHPWWRIRYWSIRGKIITLLLPPLLSLVALWVFTTAQNANSAVTLLATQTNYQHAIDPSSGVLAALQKERQLSMVYVGGGFKNNTDLLAQRAKTDTAINTLRTNYLHGSLSGSVKTQIGAVLTATDTLGNGRREIDTRGLDQTGTMQLFQKPIDSVYRMWQLVLGVQDARIGADGIVTTRLNQAREILSEEDALVQGAAAAGQFTGNQDKLLVQTVGAQRIAYQQVVNDLPADIAANYQTVVDGANGRQFLVYENTLLDTAHSGGPVSVPIAQWRTSYTALNRALAGVERGYADQIAARGTPIGVSTFTQLGVAFLLGLLAVVISVVLSIRIGRSLIRRLTGLRLDAQAMADERLPSVVSRLRHGDPVDVEAETPQLTYGSDEIGAVGDALRAVQRTAVQSAVQEATLRRGLNEVFLNIARRSQTLLHRQLALLDRMERGATDPDELESLFRIDHLATRMRRHAEDLVILAGATPGRGWRNPVPMVDVVRGAVSEVEDYARVVFVALPEAAVHGRAVTDLIHLLAELLENATSYSPPHTQVQITGQLVPNGYALEIEDRGLGMTTEAIDEANLRLRMPPDFDPANSARLGLFVVALLGARHGVLVTLRSSPYGGVTAVVLIPPDLIVGATRDLTAEPAPVRALETAQAKAHSSPVPTGAAPTTFQTWEPDPAVTVSTVDSTVVPGPTFDEDPLFGTTPPYPPAAPYPPASPYPTAPSYATAPSYPAAPSYPSASADPVRPPASVAPSYSPAPAQASSFGGPTGGPSTTGTFTGGASFAGDLPSADPVFTTLERPFVPAAAPAAPQVPAPAPAPPRVPAQRSAPVGERSDEPDLTDDGLPRRQRQANLVPQLRDNTAEQPPQTAPNGQDGQSSPIRSPERVRSMMSSFQAGSERARRESADQAVHDEGNA